MAMSQCGVAGAGNIAEVWELKRPKRIDSFEKSSDAGYVVIVPMIADEYDYDLLDFMKDNLEMLPKWYGKR